MARYLVTFTQAYAVEADDADEAWAVAEEMADFGTTPSTNDVQVDVLVGLSVVK